jgi:hypothetical protein
MSLNSELKEFEDWRLVGVNGASVGEKIVDWGVQLLREDEYKDVILVFGEVSFSEEGEEDTAEMSFEYNVFYSPNKDIVSGTEELNKIAGDVMVAALEKSIEEGKAVFNEREPEQDHPTITLDE